MVGPARFLPIVLGFFIASYYMTFSSEGREVVDTINRTLITILIFWVIHQIIEPISYILSGLDKLLTRELIGWSIKSLKILIFILGLAAVLELWGIKIGPIFIPQSSRTAARPNIKIKTLSDLIIHPINSLVNNLSSPLNIYEIGSMIW